VLLLQRQHLHITIVKLEMLGLFGH